MLAYTTYGSGPPVLLIHGLAGTGEHHFGPLIAELQTAYQLIVPDLRGHGASRELVLPAPAHWFAQHVADVGALLEHLSLDAVDVLGYSDGAEIALLLAARYAERIASMTGWGISGQIPPLAIVEVYAQPQQHIPNWPAFQAELVMLHGAQGPLILQRWAEAMRQLHAQGGTIIDPTIQQITCPILLITGDRDPFNPLVNVQALAAQLPTSSLVVLAGAGHDLLAERPRELERLIQRMLEKS